MSGTKAYDKLLEKATSPLLLEVDWDCILRMCDLIRQGDVQAKYAVAQIRKKMTNENVNTVIFSLQCLESIVKNCGSKVHQEIATRDFMDGMRAIALAKPDPIKAKILELIQCWGHAFKNNPNYKIVEDYFNSMKLEGFQFPVLKESEAMFDVEEAPAWKEDSECQSCFRCRSDFSTLRRRHHCRACGQIFCHACSSKTAAIPKYGIEKEVRVCDLCFEKLKINPSATTLGGSDQLPIEYLNSALFKEATKTTPSAAATSAQPKKPAEKTEQEFEEELQLALALSQSEAEAAEMKKKKSTSSSITNGAKSAAVSASTTQNNTNNTNKLYPSNLSQFKDDSNKNESSFKQSKTKQSWQQDSRSASFNESASVNNGASAPFMENIVKSPTKIANDKQTSNNSSYSDEELRINNEIDEFVDELKKILELYINRMKSDSLRGRSITNDTAVQSLFLQLQQMHPKLLSFIKYQEDARGYYENLQDKLTQLKDAREALNALRHENFEKKKRENEERERIRQVQIAQKLQHMRQQKQSYYQYQNQLNLQRLHLQERDLQMRLEQQRQLVIKRDQQLSNGLPFPNMMSNENFNPAMMPYSPQQISMMNNGGMMNPAAMNGGNMYPQYLDQYQMQNSSIPPQSNSLPNGNMLNGHTNGLQMVDNNNIHNYQLNPIQQQQQSQPQAIYLQQQQNPQQTIQYQQQLAQMPLNNQQASQLPPPPPSQQQQQQQPIPPPTQQQPPLVYSQPQAQIQLPNQQLQYQQYQQQMQQQHQQAPINNIINEANENTIKEAQLISFD